MGAEAGMILSKHDSTGAVWPGWPEQGVVLCEPPGVQSQSVIVPDAAGGALVAWYDSRAISSASIYGHRIHPDGALDPGWAVSGEELQQHLPTDFHYLLAIPDGEGGLVFAYGDSLGAVDSTGSRRPGWPPPGARGIEAPRIASDGLQGAYILSERIVRRFAPPSLYYVGAVLGRYELSGAASPGWPDTGRVIFEGNTAKLQTPVALLASEHGPFAFWADAGEPRGLRGLRLTSDGQLAPGWSESPPVVTTIGYTYAPTLLPSGDAVIAWSGTTYDGGNTSSEDTLFAQRLGVDGPVATLASVAVAEVRGDVAMLEWLVVDPPASSIRVERGVDGLAWEDAGSAEMVGGDRVRFSDPGLRPGERRAYRLSWFEDGRHHTAGLVWVERAALEALRFVSGRLARSPERLVLTLVLPNREPVSAQLLDVQGRVVFEQRILPTDAGLRTVDLEPRDWTPGLYLVRLRQGTAEANGRLLVVR